MELELPKRTFENAERLQLYNDTVANLKNLLRDIVAKGGLDLTKTEINRLRKEDVITYIINYKKEKGEIVSKIVKLPDLEFVKIPNNVLSYILFPKIDVPGILSLLQVHKNLYTYETENRLDFWNAIFKQVFPEYIDANFAKLFERKEASNFKVYDKNAWKKICIWMTWAHRRILKQLEGEGELELLRNEKGSISTISVVKYEDQIVSTPVFADKIGFYKGRLLAHTHSLQEDQDDTEFSIELEQKRGEWSRKISLDKISIKENELDIFKLFEQIAKDEKIKSKSELLQTWKEYPQIGPVTEKGMLFLGERQCVVCEEPTNLVCNNCKKNAYCGTECQSKHWYAEHKHDCK